MDNAQFVARYREMVQRHDQGDSASAVEICAAIIADESVPDLDRSLAAVNLATILRTGGAPDEQVEAAYDRGVRLEHRWSRSDARGHKVAWLAEAGRPAEAIRILELLINEPWLQLADRDRMQGNLTRLRAAVPG